MRAAVTPRDRYVTRSVPGLVRAVPPIAPRRLPGYGRPGQGHRSFVSHSGTCVCDDIVRPVDARS